MKRQGVYRYLLYFAAFTVFTFLFFLYGFPAGRLTNIVNGRLGAASGSTLSISEASLEFPMSLRFKGLEMTWSGKEVLLGDGVASPDLVGLLTGKRGGKVRLDGPLGKARLSLRSGGSGIRLTIGSLDAELPGISAALELPVQVDGAMGGSALFETGELASGRWSGGGVIRGSPVILTGPVLEAFGLAPINLTGLTVSFSMEENLLSLGESHVEGDLGATARGTIKVAPERPGSSRLDLVVELRPGVGTREKIVPLLTLMGARPQADGGVRLKVRGTVGRPVIAQ